QRHVRQPVFRLALGSRRRRACAAGSRRFCQLLVEKEGPGRSRGPERRNMRAGNRGRWALVIVAAAALVFAAAAAARTHSATKKGWKTADLAKDTAIVYFRAVVSAFKARFKQLGGKIKYETTYKDKQYGGTDVGNAVTGINAHKAAVIVTSTAGAFGSLGSFITGIRTAHNKTPILNSWAGDGTYWVAGLNPKVTNYWFVTYANA